MIRNKSSKEVKNKGMENKHMYIKKIKAETKKECRKEIKKDQREKKLRGGRKVQNTNNDKQKKRKGGE